MCVRDCPMVNDIARRWKRGRQWLMDFDGWLAHRRGCACVDCMPFLPRLRPPHLQNARLYYVNHTRSTIYALSTPPGKGGVAVIRISGPASANVYKQLIRPQHASCNPQHAHMKYCSIIHPKEKDIIDRGLCVYFKGDFGETDDGKHALSNLPFASQARDHSPPRTR